MSLLRFPANSDGPTTPKTSHQVTLLVDAVEIMSRALILAESLLPEGTRPGDRLVILQAIELARDIREAHQ